MTEEIFTSVSTVKQVLDDVEIKEEEILDSTYSVKQEKLGEVEGLTQCYSQRGRDY